MRWHLQIFQLLEDDFIGQPFWKSKFHDVITKFVPSWTQSFSAPNALKLRNILHYLRHAYSYNPLVLAHYTFAKEIKKLPINCCSWYSKNLITSSNFVFPPLILLHTSISRVHSCMHLILGGVGCYKRYCICLIDLQILRWYSSVQYIPIGSMRIWHFWHATHIHIVIHGQTVSLSRNTSVWLDTRDASNRVRNAADFMSVVYTHTHTHTHTRAYIYGQGCLHLT